MKLFSSLRRAVRRFRDEERGAALVTFTVMIVVLLAFAAWVTDVGVVFWNQRQIQNGVDAGALGGAYYLAQGGSSTAVQTAVAAGSAMAQKNGVSSAELSAVSNNPYVTTTFNTNDTLVVSAKRLDNYGLRYASGGSDVTIGTNASAIVVALQPDDIWPWAVTSDTSTNCSDCAMKVGSQGSAVGNFRAITFSGNANDYQNEITDGYTGTVPSPTGTNASGVPTWNWSINTEPGNKSGTTTSGIQQLLTWDAAKECDGGSPSCANLYQTAPDSSYNPLPDGTACWTDVRCPRVGIVPYINQTWSQVSGNSSVTVIGFGCFYINSYQCSNGCGNNGQLTVYGRFISYCYDVGGTNNNVLYQAPLNSTGEVGLVLWK